MYNDCEVFGHYHNEIHKNMKSTEVSFSYFLSNILQNVINKY